ncbi:hypothetical protein IW140_002319 [Coemansia sp. RSA 1813]|nr:hypothetical protein EV178_001983 [Coemansia sp. RSA 1646]KAJ1769378.1 hypothetical protein LPJ74_004087 [Coemansia sp. RSA 1843]KAJ2570419.1 hypothetical protein IW140_002319 [Coemansia sp. RSA 1813]
MTRVAIVTGASQGIGLAISKRFLEHGVSVIAVARSHETLTKLQETLVAKYGQSAFIPCTADVTKPEDIDSINQCLEQNGLELCALVNNAGVLKPLAKIADLNIDQWRQHFEVNVTSVVALTQKLMPALRKNKGCVVNISSGAASHAYHGWSAYCASKAALNMVTESLATEEPDVVALAIRPGVVDTGMQTIIRDSGEEAMHPAEHTKFKELHTTGGLLPPEKPAHTIVKLALRAPKEISGKFYSWDSPEIAKYVK